MYIKYTKNTLQPLVNGLVRGVSSGVAGASAVTTNSIAAVDRVSWLQSATRPTAVWSTNEWMMYTVQ